MIGTVDVNDGLTRRRGGLVKRSPLHRTAIGECRKKDEGPDSRLLVHGVLAVAAALAATLANRSWSRYSFSSIF